MATFLFSNLATGTHLNFNVASDLLRFDLASISAADVRFSFSGNNLGLTAGGKTVWLDHTALGQLDLGSGANTAFADGSVLAIGDGTTDTLADWYGQEYLLGTRAQDLQVWGLGGADRVTTGRGDDRLVGNVALTPLNHVSRAGDVGSPTNSASPTISADGRYVGFSGSWSSFGSTDNNSPDVFVKDLTLGSVGNEHESATGENGGSGAGGPAISADGRFLAYSSASTNLVPGVDPGAFYDIYLSGVGNNTIQRVSTTSSGTLASDGRSIDPDVSGDGRHVAFTSDVVNFAPSSTNAYYDVFVKDMQTGKLVRLSTSLTGTEGNYESRNVSISVDGRLVAFQSDATNLTASDTNGATDIFMWDRNGGGLTNLTQGANGSSRNPDIVFDDGWGGFAVFESDATNLLTGSTTSSTQIFSTHLDTEARSLVSSSAAGVQGNRASSQASASGDGRFVVFTSYATNLVSGDTNEVSDVFVKDTHTGAIARVSVGANGAQANLHSGNASISLGGEWIVFESSASNLAATDDNGTLNDVFRVSNPLLRDTLIGGAGNDSYVVDRADVLTEGLNGGTDTVSASLSWSLGANFENLVLTGSAVNGNGNALANVITGNARSNTIDGKAGTDTASYAAATVGVTVSLAAAGAQVTGAGSDTLVSIENLTGSTHSDRLTGNSGANRLDGGLGNDTLTGGAGADTYVANTSGDVVVEAGPSSEIDRVIAGVTWTLQSTLETLTLSGSANLSGGGNSRANLITGNSGNNTLRGYGGNDTLDGGLGSDTLVGSTGSDTYVTNAATDVIVEDGADTTETDTVIAGVNWTLQATLENLTLSGSANLVGSGNTRANVITGNSGSNSLSGASGNDTLSGAAGNDTLVGGAGSDRLSGGSGADHFTFNSSVGFDTVTDFATGSDRLRISQSALRLGDGDLLIDGGVTRSAPNGFSKSAELAIFTTDLASVSSATAAAAIGSASSAYSVGQQALFAVDNGSTTALYLFTSSAANAQVSASELTLLGLLNGAESTVLTDYVFVA